MKKLVFIFILLIGLAYLSYMVKQKDKIQSENFSVQKKEQEILKKKEDSISLVKEKIAREKGRKKRKEEENKNRNKPQKQGKYQNKFYTDYKTGEIIGPGHPKHGLYQSNDRLREKTIPADMTKGLDILIKIPDSLFKKEEERQRIENE